MYPASSLAARAPSTIFDEGVLFMPLRFYADGSETQHVVLTLGAVVADESVWAPLEAEWTEVLQRYDVRYSHMREVTGAIGPFAKWTQAKREQFVFDLVRVLEGYGPNEKIRQYACWVDLHAYERWASVRNHPRPERLCARVVFPTFVHNWPGIIDIVDVWFDQGEPFMTHIREDWENKELRRKQPVWTVVRTIASADMKKTPGLQMADLIAWSRNRFQTVVRNLGPHDGVDALSVSAIRVINHGLRGLHREIGEKAMAESTFSEEGLRRKRLFERARKRHR